MLWKQKGVNVDGLNNIGTLNMPKFLEIEFTEVGDDYLIARMPVNDKTKQPMGRLHGGASVVLAETMGSVASILCIEDVMKQTAVGVSINANHLNGIKEGFVYGKVTPVKIGRTIHVWEINLYDKENKPICRSRLTTQVINIKAS